MRNVLIILIFMLFCKFAEAGPIVLYNSSNQEIGTATNPLYVTGAANLSAVDSNIYPETDNVYDIGSAALRWNDGYFGGNITVDGVAYYTGTTSKISSATTIEITPSVYVTGNVGIGTSFPTANLAIQSVLPTFDIRSTSLTDADYGIIRFIYGGGAVDADQNLGGLAFGGLESDGGTNYGAVIKAVALTAAGSTYVPADLQFFTSSTSLTEKMRIQAGGNVGIGTTTPLAKLSVGNTAGTVLTSVDGVNDVYIKDSLEIDGNLYVDGFIYVRGTVVW